MIKSKYNLDLMNFKLVKKFFKNEKPDIVINAAKSWGYFINQNYPYQFLLENLKFKIIL